MKHGVKLLICTAAGLVLCPAANAVNNGDSGSPYQGIIERNAFGLKPPLPPKPEDTQPLLPRFIFQGIIDFGGIKRALLKAQMPSRPGESPTGEQSFILAEGQRDGDIEVLSIDAKAGAVKLSAFGSVTNLNFANNGIKTAAADAASSATFHPGMGFPPPGIPGVNPSVPPSGAQPNPAVQPTRPAFPTGAADSQVTAEERFLLVEAYRAKLKQMGQDHALPPAPPTPLTSQLQQ